MAADQEKEYDQADKKQAEGRPVVEVDKLESFKANFEGTKVLEFVDWNLHAESSVHTIGKKVRHVLERLRPGTIFVVFTHIILSSILRRADACGVPDKPDGRLSLVIIAFGFKLAV